jgi:hypothetical protein
MLRVVDIDDAHHTKQREANHTKFVLFSFVLFRVVSWLSSSPVLIPCVSMWREITPGERNQLNSEGAKTKTRSSGGNKLRRGEFTCKLIRAPYFAGERCAA